MKKRIWIIAASLLFGVLTILPAQTEKALLTQLADEEKNAVEALVLYPEDVRLAILEAAKYPEVLIKMEGMQQQTSNDFEKLLESYPQELQQDIWDLTRYPDLVARLVLEGDRSPGKIRTILNDYPDVIHQRALKVGADYYNLLERVDALQQSSQLAFQGLIAEYPPAARDAFERLTDLPEVLTILTDNIRLTILVGDIYQKDPDWVWYKADSLNLVVAQQRAQDLEEWKQSLENNPDALEELKNTADAYADEYGYDDVYYDYEDDIYYDNEVENIIVERHYYHHYSYWLGYPSWYVYPRWRPYPWWYDWGFYIRPTGRLVVIGFPSYYVTNWYFYHPHHWYHYPHLTDHFVDYYYGHRRSTGSVVAGVDNWVKDHQPVLGNDGLADPRGRVDRIRDLGKMEEARRTYNQRHPDKAVSQRDYLEKNTRRYPNLSKTAPPRTTPKVEDRTEPTVPNPRVRTDRNRTQQPPKVDPPTRNQPTDKVTIPRTRTQPRTQPPTEPKKTDFGRIDKAKDVHRQNWEKPKAPTRTPRPTVTPPRTRTPKTTPRTTPKSNNNKSKSRSNQNRN